MDGFIFWEQQQCCTGAVWQRSQNIPLGSNSLMRPSSPSPLGTNLFASLRSSSIDSEDTTPPANDRKFPSEGDAEHPFFKAKAKQEITKENLLSRTNLPPPPERQLTSQLVIGSSETSKQCEVSEAENIANRS